MHAHLLFIESCNDNTVIGTFWSFLEEAEKRVGKQVRHCVKGLNCEMTRSFSMAAYLRQKHMIVIMITIFVPISVLYDDHMYAILFILQRTAISNILFHLNNPSGNCTLLRALRL